MIMKKVLLLSLALVVMFSASSCQKENVSLRTRSVSLSVVLPGAPATKAIADGEKALRLYYATYTEDGKMLSSLSNIVDGVAVSGKTATVKDPVACGVYRIKSPDGVLNIRKGPGASYDKVGQVKNGEAYTITKINGSWGYLKSGAGWINLSYTEKVK